jgi:hypothetical protein
MPRLKKTWKTPKKNKHGFTQEMIETKPLTTRNDPIT